MDNFMQQLESNGMPQHPDMDLVHTKHPATGDPMTPSDWDDLQREYADSEHKLPLKPSSASLIDIINIICTLDPLSISRETI